MQSRHVGAPPVHQHVWISSIRPSATFGHQKLPPPECWVQLTCRLLECNLPQSAKLPQSVPGRVQMEALSRLLWVRGWGTSSGVPSPSVSVPLLTGCSANVLPVLAQSLSRAARPENNKGCGSASRNHAPKAHKCARGGCPRACQQQSLHAAAQDVGVMSVHRTQSQMRDR